MAEMPALREVRINDMSPAAAKSMVEQARAEDIPAVVSDSPSDAVQDASVVVTATQSTAPLFAADDLAPGVLICAVGATKYDRCEIGADVVEAAVHVVCDDVVGSRIECGDLIQAAAAGRFDWTRAVELHDVVAGNVVLERSSDALTLFETQGVALQDVAAAGLAWERWTARTT